MLSSTDTPDTLPGPPSGPLVVRVLPDVSGLDKEFDYRLPDALVAQRASLDDFLGALVRVPLHGRRVVGWITAVDPPQAVAPERLHDVIAVVSHGPAPELLALAEWAAVRWAAGRLRPFLATASPPRRITALPPARRSAPSVARIDRDDPVVAAYAELAAEAWDTAAAGDAGGGEDGAGVGDADGVRDGAGGAAAVADASAAAGADSAADGPSGSRAVAAPAAGGSASAPVATALGESSGDGMRAPDRATIAVAPTTSPLPLIASFAVDGPTLVVVPSVARAAAMAAALRRRGLAVALLPDDWALAAAGVDVAIGARAAAWAPCPGLRSVVVVDEHDEAMQEERAPTWHAREVLAERARRAGARFVLTSPAPSVASWEYAPRLPIDWGPMVAGSPLVEIVDRRDEEPWKSSLVTSRLIHFLRQPALRVVCVHNVPGRSRVLACRSCRELARCARCDAAVGLADDGRFSCGRCGEQRPQVCSACGGGAFANLKPGVSRLAEELAAAAGREVASVTATTATLATGITAATTVTASADAAPTGTPSGPTLPDVGVHVGTEAVLHRVAHADVVAFLDIDRELLAPRFRAPEQTLGLLVRGARLLGPRRRGGRLLIQTYLPDDPVLQAALRNDPLAPSASELPRREAMHLPPAAALAAVSGAGSDELIGALRTLTSPVAGLAIGGGACRYLVGADDWMELGAALLDAKRASGTRPRIEVDPPRA